jgi:hypothetical protein
MSTMKPLLSSSSPEEEEERTLKKPKFAYPKDGGAPYVNEKPKYTYLQNLNPHPLDNIVHFEPRRHVYFLPDKPEEELVSATTYWKDYFPEFPGYMMNVICNSIQTRFSFWYENRKTLAHHKVPHKRFKNEPIWPNKYDCFIPPSTFQYLNEHDNPSAKWIAEHQPLPAPFGTYKASDVSEAWTRDGTALHLQIERYLNNAIREDEIVQSREWTYFLQFLEDHKHEWRVYRTEMRIYDPDTNIAGTIDCVMQNIEDGSFIFVDWKRSKRMKKRAEDDTDYDDAKCMKAPFEQFVGSERNKHVLQLNTYTGTTRKHYSWRVSKMLDVILHPSNSGPIEAPVEDIASFKPKNTFKRLYEGVLDERKEKVKRRRQEQADNSYFFCLGAYYNTVGNAHPTLSILSRNLYKRVKSYLVI